MPVLRTSKLTPCEQRGQFWFKRDDLYSFAGVNGGKVRTCRALAVGAVGLVTAGARASPQCEIVAYIGRAIGVPVRVHTPSGALGKPLISANKCGAEIVQHRPGYNTVLIARARQDAAMRGWKEIPFGMECLEAIRQTRTQTANLPYGQFTRLVVPVGSGMSLAGILWGLRDVNEDIAILGAVVGASPEKRLDRWGPYGWRKKVTLINAGTPYHQPAISTKLNGLHLDPFYEAKCSPFMQPGDLLWVVGIRRLIDEKGGQIDSAPNIHAADTVLSRR